MFTDTPEGRKYIEDVSKHIVAEYASEELDLFDELMAEYIADPTPPDLSTSSEDDALAFGLNEVIVAVTPAATAMTTAVLAYIIKDFAPLIQEKSAEWIKANINRIFAKKDEKKGDDGFQPLTRDQLKEVKRIARRQAKKFGMETDMAHKMVEALIGALVLAK